MLSVDTLYLAPHPTQWARLPFLMAGLTGAIAVLAVLLFLGLRQPAGALRSTIGALGAASLFAGPLLNGRTGLALMDFGMPAFAMLGSLNIVDAFYLRPVAETQQWTLFQASAQLFAFPKEDSTATSPRLENLKAIVRCLLKYAVVNVLLYLVPPPQAWAQIRVGSLAYFLHSTAAGFCVLFTLASIIETILRIIGILCGMEMNPMFANPNNASNIRDFWARWNLPIKNGLSRVVFHGSAPPVSPKTASIALPQSPNTSSDTLRQRKGKGKGKDDSEVPNGEKSAEVKQRGAFIPKAIAALATFVASGLFHEVMNNFAFRSPFGENLAFFATHGLATIFYSYLHRYHRGVLRAVPRWMGVALVNGFAILTAGIFVGVFIRAGFFEDFKSFGIFGRVDRFFWVFGDGYGGHAWNS